MELVGSAVVQGGEEFRLGQSSVAVPQFGAGVDQKGVDLPPGGLLGLDRGSAGDVERTEGFDTGILRAGGGLTRQDRAGSSVGVERIALALLALICWAGAVDLDHLDPGSEEFSGDAHPVAGGALHADAVQGPSLDEPSNGSSVAGHGGGELPIGHGLADPGDHRDVDRVAVRIDATGLNDFFRTGVFLVF